MMVLNCTCVYAGTINEHLIISCWSLKQIYPLINKCFKVNNVKQAFIRIHLKKKKSLIHTLHDIRISISI